MVLHTDNGAATDCGTLSYAYYYITSTANVTITFSLRAGRTINVTGNGYNNYSLPPGIALDGGNDCNNPVILDGSGTLPGANGLSLHGSNVAKITVTHFKAKQIIAFSGGNQLSCIKVVT